MAVPRLGRDRLSEPTAARLRSAIVPRRLLRSRRDQFFVLWTAATRCISRLGRACRRSSPAMYPRRGNTRSGLTELNGNLTAVGKSRYGQSHGSRRGRGGRASAASILSEEQQRNEENGGHTRDQSHGTILSWNQDPCRLSQWTDGALSVPMCPLTRSRSPVLFLQATGGPISGVPSSNAVSGQSTCTRDLQRPASRA